MSKQKNLFPSHRFFLPPALVPFLDFDVPAPEPATDGSGDTAGALFTVDNLVDRLRGCTPSSSPISEGDDIRDLRSGRLLTPTGDGPRNGAT
jgi:hypothetical protein